MDSKDVKVGKVYRGKQSRQNIFGNYNDRIILWISPNKDYVQYDSISVKMGHHYPKIKMDQFCKWAKYEVVEGEENGIGIK
jgi:hypothetical protein